MSNYVARLAKWPSFARRNVSALLRRSLHAADGPEVWLGATVCGFARENGRLDRVVSSSTDGRGMTVRADRFIVAAGAIESTRLLLLMARDMADAPFARSPMLGTGFQDHLSAPVARLTVHDRRALNRLVGFRFEGATMRNLRFELAPASPARNHLRPAFAHVAFEKSATGGFDVLRRVMQHVQRRESPPLSVAGDLARSAPWLMRALWWRLAEKRLLYPPDAAIELHMVVEQPSRPHNRITLDPFRRDIHGMPLAAIDWRVDEEDVTMAEAHADLFLADWIGSPFEAMATMHRYPRERIGEAMTGGGGIYHPTGSTRMGSDIATGVVDRDLKVFGLDNVQVVATSVMPTGGGANPTMTLLMLGLRASAQIAAKGS